MTSKRSANPFFFQQYNGGNGNEDGTLFAAAREGDVKTLEEALKNGANPNYTSRKDEGSPFPLHEAVKIDDDKLSVACTKLLLDHGANVNLTTITTKNTPLHEGE